MHKHFTVPLIGLCALFVFIAGCASTWSICSETPGEPTQWRDDAKLTRAHHVSSLRGFKETGSTASHVLKQIVFGQMDARNMIIRPIAAAVGNDRRFAIADPGCECVHLYIPSTQQYYKVFNAGEETLQSPVGVAFDDVSRMYVSDSMRGVIYVFDKAGKHLFTIRNAGYTDLRRPTGLSYSPKKNILYAVDTLANKVLAYTTTGSLLFSFGEAGEKNGQFNFPTHITTAPDGRVYVIDSMNFRVQVFDASGKFLTSFGHHGNGSGDFSMPKGIAVDKSGVIYVVDTLFDNIQLFNLAGRFLFTIGGRGTGEGEFWMPSGVFLDDQNMLYVCDTYNQRVQIYQVTGNPQ